MKTILLLIISAFFASSTIAENTESFQLQNGLKIIVRQDHRAPVVLSSIWYKVGGSYESNGITGISHLLEHLMFRGTKKFGPGVFNKLMSTHGGDDNAMTTNDFTTYYQTLRAKDLPLSFALEADRMENLALNEKIVENEKQVVMEERRMRVDDNPEARTWERFVAAAFVNNPYHHPTVGWMTDIDHLTLHDVQDWYDKWYAPNNAVIIVVGDVDPKAVFALAEQYFGNIKAKKIQKLKPRDEISSLGEKKIYVDLPAKLPFLTMGYLVPTLVTTQDKKIPYALTMCAYILSAGNSSRFTIDLIHQNKIAVSAEANYDRFQLHETLFSLSGIPAPNHTNDQLKKAMLAEIKKLQTTLVSTAELNRIKAQVVASSVYQQDSLIKQALDLGRPEMDGMSWRESDDFTKNIGAITPEEIRLVAKKYFIKNNLTVAELVPK